VRSPSTHASPACGSLRPTNRSLRTFDLMEARHERALWLAEIQKERPFDSHFASLRLANRSLRTFDLMEGSP